MRGTIAASLGGGTSIYGPLSAPIVLLIWLYALAIAVLIGAAVQRRRCASSGPHEEQRACTSGSPRGSAGCGDAAPSAASGRAGWDDPFDGYGSAQDHDDLGLSGLRDAARGPLTPMSGAGRSTPAARPGRPPVEAGHRVDADR